MADQQMQLLHLPYFHAHVFAEPQAIQDRLLPTVQYPRFIAILQAHKINLPNDHVIHSSARVPQRDNNDSLNSYDPIPQERQRPNILHSR